MPAALRKPSPQTLAVLAAVGGAGAEGLYGLEISAATGLKSGSLYPILARLAERGLLEGRWLEPSAPGRPARQAYRLTAEGHRAVAAAGRPAAVVLKPGRSPA